MLSAFLGEGISFLFSSILTCPGLICCTVSLEEEDVQTYAAAHPFRVVPANLSEFGKVGVYNLPYLLTEAAMCSN